VNIGGGMFTPSKIQSSGDSCLTKRLISDQTSVKHFLIEIAFGDADHNIDDGFSPKTINSRAADMLDLQSPTAKLRPELIRYGAKDRTPRFVERHDLDWFV
jgi:hypothetical protein